MKYKYVMDIISHRGYWEKKQDQNSLDSFYKSFEFGFGVETDIRDSDSRLVISHDMPSNKAIELKDFLNIYKKYSCKTYLPLALNIKSDGLSCELLKNLKEFEISDYFVFDMSIPDSISYLKNKMNVFGRASDIEICIPKYEIVQGVWLDTFEEEWIDESVIQKFVSDNKKVCIVSPELHGRNNTQFWSMLKNVNSELTYKIAICTDFPEQANNFFNE